ncbi:uncharacterized protein [Amphiura filiformis]|uniref:uncharacterized protein n=1 Tax=Amphiura filiformis TaxID=82378 RepID=UPI003B22004D
MNACMASILQSHKLWRLLPKLTRINSRSGFQHLQASCGRHNLASQFTGLARTFSVNRSNSAQHFEPDTTGPITANMDQSQTRGPLTADTHQSQAGSCEQQKVESDRKRQLVIFDKDGTIACVHAMYAPWIRALAIRLQNATNLDLADKLYDLLAFDDETGKFLPGLLGEGTAPQVRHSITQLLLEAGLPREKAERIMQDCYEGADMTTYGNGPIEGVGDVGDLFRVLKSKGYLIAVNTSDCRRVTEKTLDHLNVKHHVDMVVCGDDEGHLAKPHPYSAQKICSELEVHPGDTIMKLGCNAGLRCSIGVLTGITTREVLERDATYVVDNIHHALNLILEDSS